MRKLPRGVTGFYRGGRSKAPKRRVERHVAMRACFEACWAQGWRVEGEDVGLGPMKNFIQLQIAHYRGARCQLLINQFLPCIGASAPPTEERGVMAFDFVDVPVSIWLPDVWIATGEELREPLTTTMLEDLARAEMEQVNYWNPRCVGELLFNFWD